VMWVLTLVFLVAGAVALVSDLPVRLMVHAYMMLVILIALVQFYYSKGWVWDWLRTVKLRFAGKFESGIQVGVLTDHPLLREILVESSDHPFQFQFLDSAADLQKSLGLIDVLLIAQGEKESLDALIRRLKKLYMHRSIPCLVMSESPETIASLIGDAIPDRSVALPLKPLYVHPILINLAHLVGAANLIFPSQASSPRRPTEKVEVVCADS